MKRLTYLILGVMIFVVGSFAQSQEPPPGPPKASKEQQNKPSPKQAESKDHQRGTDNLPFVVKIAKTSPTAQKESDNTKNSDNKSSSDWWKIIFDASLVIFNGLLAAFTLGLLISTRKMWKSTEKIANVAKDTLIATQRPWIWPDFSIASPLTFDEDGAHITFAYTLSNSGNTPATNVEVHPKLFAFEWGEIAGTPPNITFVKTQTNPAMELTELCERTVKNNDMLPVKLWLGDTIFPNRKLSSGVNMGIAKSEIEVARQKSTYKIVVPVFFACVTYRFPFDSKSRYTGLAFHIFRNDPASAGGAREINPDEGTVQANELRLMPYPFSSGLAS